MNIQQFKQIEAKRKRLAADTSRRQRQSRQRAKKLQQQEKSNRQQALAAIKQRSLSRKRINKIQSSTKGGDSDKKWSSAKKWKQQEKRKQQQKKQSANQFLQEQIAQYQVQGQQQEFQISNKQQHNKQNKFNPPQEDSHLQDHYTKEIKKQNFLSVADSLDLTPLTQKKQLKQSQLELQRLLGIRMDSQSIVKQRKWLDQLINESPLFGGQITKIKKRYQQQNEKMKLGQINKLLDQNSESLKREYFLDSLNQGREINLNFDKMNMPINQSIQLDHQSKKNQTKLQQTKYKSKQQKKDTQRVKSKQRIMKQYDTKRKQQQIKHPKPQQHTIITQKDILQDSLFSNPIQHQPFNIPSQSQINKSKQSFVSQKAKKRLNKVNQIITQQKPLIKQKGYADIARVQHKPKQVSQSILQRQLIDLQQQLQQIKNKN